MRDPHEITVRLQTIDGRWETVGRDRYTGINAQHFTATANRWGSDTCSFQLRRDAGAIHPDLSAFTPCEVEIAGLLSWSGRVKETPTRDAPDSVITVNGQGWQYHLDDDVIERFYVHSRLSDWRDSRSFVGQNLGNFKAGGQVTVGDGMILIAYPTGYTFNGAEYTGVTLDLGPGRTAKRIVLTYTLLNPLSSFANFQVRGHDTEDPIGGLNEVPISLDFGSAAASDTVAATFGTARRYITVYLNPNGATGVGGFQRAVKITAVSVFADTAYEAGDVSILTADQIVNDTLDHVAPFLSSDRSGIEAGMFSYPDFAPAGDRSGREQMISANACENYETKVDVDRRMLFRPRAFTPIYEIGEWSGAGFAEGTANSGDEIYNRARAQGTGPDGAARTITRTSATALEEPNYRRDELTPQATNPSFDVDTAGWTGNDGAIVRDTATFDSSPASGRLDKTSGFHPELYTETWTAEFVPGFSYRLTLRIRAAQASPNLTLVVNPPGTLSILTGIPYYQRVIANAELSTSEFRTFTADFVPLTPVVRLILLSEPSSGAVAYVDNVEIQRAVNTIIDRRGFLRSKALPVRSAATVALLERLGDIYLRDRMTTPFAGDFTAVGQGGVRRVLGGQAVHPGWLLRDTGQLVRCSHRVDPDTGGWGRDGEIDSVSYNHDELTAEVSLDENRAGFEALLERLAVVVGGAG